MKEMEMQLEDDFDFIPPPYEQIRIKGTRIGIEHVIRLHNLHMIPAQIAVYFVCPLTVEQVYATITYYLKNKDVIDAYIKRIDDEGERHYREYLRQPQSELVKRILAIKVEREAASVIQ